MSDALTILLIEDNPDDRVLIRHGLEKHFSALRINEVLSPATFDQALDGGDFDLVIVDYHLGWADGITVTRQVKQHYPETPVLMFTITGSEEVAVQAMKAGLDDYVLKSPSQFALLPGIIESLLRHGEQRRALAEAEARYRTLFDGVPIGLFRSTLDGRMLDANLALVALLNYPDRKTLLQAPVAELYLDPAVRTAMLAALDASGVVLSRELELRCYDGQPVLVSLNARQVPEVSGPPRYIEGSIEDITERKRIEAALRQSQLLNTNIIESVQEGVVVYDRDLRYLVWNRFMEDITGLKARDVLGKAASEVFPDLAAQGMLNLLQRVLQGETVRSSDIPYYVAHTGKTGWTQGTYSPLASPEGQVVGVVATIHDITKRKQTETEREHLLAAEQQRARQFAALNAAAANITSSLDLNEVLESFAFQLGQLLEVDSCSISMWDRASDTISMQVEYNVGPEDHANEWRRPVSLESIPMSAQVLRQNVTLQANRNSPNLPPLTAEYMEQYGIFSTLMLPLSAKGEVIGIVELEDNTRLREFDEQEIILAETITSQAAATIENARLFEATRRQLRELGALHTLASIGSQATDEDAFIGAATELISQYFYPDNFGVLLFDPSENALITHPSYQAPTLMAGAHINLTEGVCGRVFRSGQPVRLDDVSADPDYIRLDSGSQSELCVPLKLGKEVIGVVNAESHRLAAFTPDDERLMTTLAGQMTVVIERLRSREAEQRHARHLALLNSLGRDLSGLLEIHQLCQLVATRLHTDFGYTNVGVLFMEEGQQTLKLEAISRPYGDKIVPGIYRQSINEGLLGIAARTRKYVVSNNVDEHPDYIPPDVGGIRAELAIPLTADDELIGVLNIDSDQYNTFDADEISALTTLADQLALALAKARLLETERRQRQQAETLREVAAILSTATDREVVLDLILQQLHKVVAYDSAAVMLLRGSRLVIEAVGGNLPADMLGYFFEADENKPAQPILQERKTVILDDVRQFPGWLTSPKSEKILSWLGVPLVARGEVIGVLTVDGYRPNQFSQEDAQLTTAFAHHAANALENARLFAEVTESLAREQQLNEITRKLTQELGVESALADVVRMACESVGAEAGSLGLLLPDGETMEFPYVYNPMRNDYTRTSKRGEGLAWRLVETGESILLNAYSDHPESLEHHEAARAKAFIAAPVWAGDTVIGGLAVYFVTQPGHFSQRDLKTIETIGRQAGIAIQNARLFQETITALAREQRLNEVTLTISRALEQQTLFEQIGRLACELVGGDTASIGIINPETGEPVAGYYYNKPDEVDPAILPRGQGLMWDIMETGESLLVVDYRAHPKAMPTWVQAGVRGFIGVPIQTPEGVIGVLGIFSRDPARVFNERDLALVESIGRQAGVAVQNTRLYEELEDAYVQTVVALANAMDVRDSYTGNHSERMAVWVEEIGRALALPARDLESLRWAALLHDIGKIGVPDEVLLKPAALSDEEYRVIRRHPELGASIVAPVKKLTHVAPIIRSHQEWYDGSGYPDGLKGEDIPLGARVLAVVDAYSAITDNRVYRAARSPQTAIDELRAYSGTQFDPQVVSVFLKLLESKKKTGKARKAKTAPKPKAKSAPKAKRKSPAKKKTAPKAKTKTKKTARKAG
ncbi:MAG: GAF domain-containing protein [Chloroflexi bacterium]|nr:GAF domain-containing protein [Chloroflexota bacterium]